MKWEVRHGHDDDNNNNDDDDDDNDNIDDDDDDELPTLWCQSQSWRRRNEIKAKTGEILTPRESPEA